MMIQVMIEFWTLSFWIIQSRSPYYSAFSNPIRAKNISYCRFCGNVEASNPKWVNSNDISYGVNSFRLAGLHMSCDILPWYLFSLTFWSWGEFSLCLANRISASRSKLLPSSFLWGITPGIHLQQNWLQKKEVDNYSIKKTLRIRGNNILIHWAVVSCRDNVINKKNYIWRQRFFL